MASLYDSEGSTKDLLVSIQVVSVKVKARAELLTEIFVFTMARLDVHKLGTCCRLPLGLMGAPVIKLESPDLISAPLLDI